MQGSAEALCSSLESIEVSDDLLRVRTRVLRSGAGAITAEDVMLASVSNAVVLGFNSVAARPTREAGGAERKKESRRAQGVGGAGRHAATTQGCLGEGSGGASRRPPFGVCLFLSLLAAPRRLSLQPSCHLAVVPLSSFSPLSFPPLSRRSLLPRPVTPPPAGPLFSRLLSPVGATPSSSCETPTNFFFFF